MEEFSIGSSPVVQSIEHGSVEKKSLKGMEGPWRTVIMCQNIKRLSGKIPVFLQHPSPAGPDNKQTGGQRNQHTRILSHYTTLLPKPSQYICADWFLWGKVILNSCCKTCNSFGVQRVGRSVPLLFVLYLMTSLGIISCQQYAWQQVFCLLRQSANSANVILTCAVKC